MGNERFNFRHEDLSIREHLEAIQKHREAIDKTVSGETEAQFIEPPKKYKTESGYQSKSDNQLRNRDTSLKPWLDLDYSIPIKSSQDRQGVRGHTAEINRHTRAILTALDGSSMPTTKSDTSPRRSGFGDFLMFLVFLFGLLLIINHSCVQSRQQSPEVQQQGSIPTWVVRGVG